MTQVVAPAAERVQRPPLRKVRYNRREALAGYLFISPWIVGFLVFTAGAMIASLVISFSSYNLATNTARPAGVDNYTGLLEDPRVATALGNTLFYALLAVPLEIAFALFLASLLANVGRGAGVFRTLFYLPRMTPVVATAAVFFLLLNGNTGAVNDFLAVFGIEGPQWLVDPAWIKPSIVLMQLWAVSGTMVIFLAALKNVPRELYEVASLDGAGRFRQFWSITLPMISGAMFFNVIVLTIAAFQVFDQAYLLFWRDQTNASPEASLFYAVYLFQKAFRQFDFGFAAAMAWLLFVIILLVTLVQTTFGNRFVYYEGDRS
ncbi:carbohydrate ABC transporter permease [Cellulomonas fimi]|uniref:Binding-protein-dependent transport systems inner membrane component n=1 Tax=Cellulomonas fimi (strain ATCC 484 / DSM 20113 / JCM 1341 / CCUG 24087 / LMG 16345 / NBRC 15513 / NCIMB 8980 / NCTC 7547 / NRS-133) TaxID=590998 RepID=F4H4S5_CELFA|nr:sugar ABC transporter permease [Cellulomonas fimi]AEE44276.1 binding-protein-dependent transport systems inner membrane component [Cellulomonas fimi ATCC 484]NNH05723.1 sugar ABC transporter permease [Cellulomonas fimi]VEH26022.1 sn-glycerol-3-phosphate transport system permease protein ugpA [Cellulomonas fimi]